MQLNENFAKLPGSYLFAEIARREAAYRAENPDAPVIKLGIGDVTLPLPQACIEAMHKAVDEMGQKETFQGYPPYYGYDFLRNAIAEHDYQAKGLDIKPAEIYVSEGAKSDTGNFGDIFGSDVKVAVCDPVYPVYVDANAMAGRAGEYDKEQERWTNIYYMPCTAENGFIPALPTEKVDVIYLCFPNNPTGVVATRTQLQAWVDYANANDALILFDGAYEGFVTEENIPRSIYEIPGAKTCAVEFRSFSKTAGFTGTRCAYLVIPAELTRSGQSVAALWERRQATKYNGVSYVIQCGAAAIYTDEGKAQVQANLAYYRENAKIIQSALTDAGYEVYGAVNSPYIWAKTPDGMGSWEFFDFLLDTHNVVTTPGAGFGPSGEGYIRLTAFGSRAQTIEAARRITGKA
jgi:LL-diaminopimelate aminotransferase